jgi:membrane protein
MPDLQSPDSQVVDEADRGREAGRPGEIPAKGWKDVLWRAWKHSGEDNMSIVAGGVTYGILVALFPGLAALVSIYGLISDPADIERQLNAISHLMPAEAQKLIGDELHQLASHSGSALSIGAVVGFVLAVWAASRGMSAMITALNIAYEEKETRGFLKLNLLALGLTFGLMLTGLVAIVLVAGVPAALNFIGLGQTARWLILVLEWPLLIGFLLLFLAVLYRFAPNRDKPQWRWVSPGAVTATLLWLIASILFTVYVTNFNSYDKTYGSLGAIVILLTWLYISTYVVLLGAEINAEAERQTRKDTTVGPPEPMGQRKARAADTVGPSYEKARG